MSARLRPYRRGDAVTVSQRPELAGDLGPWLRQLDQGDYGTHAVTLADADGPIACGGWTECWPGYAILWGVVGVLTGAQRAQFARAAHGLVARFNGRRLETSVRADFQVGLRFVEWLGFEAEGVLRGYAPDGGAHVLYARVRPDWRADA